MAFGTGSGWWGRSKKPAFDALDASKTIQENAVNSAATPLDGNVTLTNADGTGFSGGKLNVSIAGATSSDALGIAETGGITVVGSDVYYQGERIGTVASSGNAGAPLTVQFDSGPVSDEAATSLARSVTYSSSSDAPSAQFRTVTFQATDAENTVGSAKLKLKVDAENDAPVVTGLSEHVVRDLADSAAPRAVDSDLVVTNPDGTGFKGGSLSVHLEGATSGDDITLAPGAYRIVDNKVYDGRKVVGTVTSDGQDGRDLTIQLKPGVNFTDANMTALTQQVAHSTSDTAPPEEERTLSYSLKDREGDVTTKQAGLSIDYPNRPPVAQDDTRTTAEDTALVIQASSLAGNDTDLDGDSLTVTAVGEASHGTVALVNGQITFTPDADYNGPASFSYTVSDGKGGTDTATVAVNVTPLNDAPTAADDTVSMAEDSTLVIFPGAFSSTSAPRPMVVLPASSLLGNDADAEGDTLTIIAVGEASHGDVGLANGEVIFTPDADYNGPASFSYTVSDGKGGTDTATVAVNVTPLNDAPTAADDTVSLAEDQELVFQQTTGGGDGGGSGGGGGGGVRLAQPTGTSTLPFSALLANDTDVDGDALTIIAVGDAVNGEVSLDEQGHIHFVPDENYNGPASFSYTVSDGNGGTDTATAVVNVTPVNDAPVAADDTVSVAEDRELVFQLDTGSGGAGGGGDSVALPARVAAPEGTSTDYLSTLLANDTDVDGDALTITAVGDAVNGAVSLDEQGRIHFVPDENFNGPASFTYTASDGHGGTDTATVMVNVTPMNDAPVAVDDVRYLVWSDQASIVAADFVANDQDVDGDNLSVIGVGDVQGGTVGLADGKITFHFNPDAASGSFTYTVSDGHGGSDIGQVSYFSLPA